MCYQAATPYAVLPCAGTGQDGEYNINPLSYTNNGDGTVTDNNTGLMWQQRVDGTQFNWYQASGTYSGAYNPEFTDVCGSLGLAGHSDWRLPSKKELVSILEYSTTSLPMINMIFLPETIAADYWSSTPHAIDLYNAWFVGFATGDVLLSNKYTAAYVRCVRGGQALSPDLADNGNGTVSDARTGLVWQQGEPGTMTWGQALSYCEELDLGGSSAWRVPNVKELESLTDDTRYWPAIDSGMFPSAAADYFSSTSRPASWSPGVYCVFFDGGGVAEEFKDSSVKSVRCVQGGESFPTVTIDATASPATEAGLATGQFTVARTGPTQAALNVKYQVGGTATAGSDYLALAGSVSIAPGSSTATIAVTPMDDLAVENEETVVVTLGADAAYAIGTSASATVTIASDEPPERFRLPDTGQTQCYQGYAEVPCAGTGQDGEYSIHPLSYTNNGDGTVRDDNTGLIWQQDDDGAEYNWYQASGTSHATHNPAATNVCGSLGLAGHSDWRLPSAKELAGILDYAIPDPGPTIMAAYFPSTKGMYWSSTSAAYDPYVAWVASFDGYYGGTVGHIEKFDLHRVRCVRGGQVGAELKDNGNGTVTDKRTGLTWQQDKAGPLSHGEAIAYCESLNLGGSSFWRLPNIKELGWLVDHTRCDPAIDPTLFPNTGAPSYSIYWSSTKNAGRGKAWYINFHCGDFGSDFSEGQPMFVRCVRGPKQVFFSRGAQDGWILESTERSRRGGLLDARSTTIRVGDDRLDRQFRGILSFDTSVLPRDSVISGATLSFRKRGVVGSDPLGTHGGLVGDIIGCGFSGSASLQLSDFGAAAGLRASINSFSAGADNWYSADLSEAELSLINKKGRTQIRLRFTKDDNDDHNADYLLIYSGNAAIDLRPMLEVNYFVP